ncbi:DUF2171 domain-containing protein [Halalkalicoccus ordinarius]|uniref:DUF2171 domain-containing protein n=1 Tax=Halalkalicoccus ordinarius TaxID=3116651 RepID=UPI00300F6CF6
MSSDSRTRPTEDDEGKNVLDANGDRVGLVAAVEGGTLHVETDPSITDDLKAALGWGDAEDTRAVDESEIERITGDTVHLASSGGGADTGTADTEGVEPGTGSESGIGAGSETGAREDVAADERAAGSGEVGDAGDGTTPRSTDTAGSEEDDTEVSEMPMDDTGDVTTGRTTESGGSDEMSETGVDEAAEDGATEEMGVPGEGVGTPEDEDVQDPAPDEPRDAEDAREVADDLDEDTEGPTENPEEQPSVGEAATRGAEEDDAKLGSDDERDDRQ